MKDRFAQLKMMMKKLDDHMKYQEDVQKKTGASNRMGAKLTSGNELQEWMDRQEYLRKNPMEVGSNVFTYKKNTNRKAEEVTEDAELAAAN